MLVVNVLAALAAATLAAMGVGGGGLAVIYLVLVLDVAQKKAQGINLIFFIIASIFSLPLHAKAKRVKWKTALVFAGTGILGSIFGCIIGERVDSFYVKKCFGIFLIISGCIAFFSVAKKPLSKVYLRVFGK